jgi:hypothetical protein
MPFVSHRLIQGREAVRGATIAAAGRQRLGCRAQGAEVPPPHPAAPKPREAEITSCMRRLEFVEETMVEAAASPAMVRRWQRPASIGSIG